VTRCSRARCAQDTFYKRVETYVGLVLLPLGLESVLLWALWYPVKLDGMLALSW
jgi:hypothetical protein